MLISWNAWDSERLSLLNLKKKHSLEEQNWIFAEFLIDWLPEEIILNVVRLDRWS